MAPDLEPIPSPDAVLMAACAAARAAVAADNAEAEKDAPGDLTPLFERERLALECIAATRARTPRGIAEKARLLDECAETTETVTLALSLADDAIALAKAMVGDGMAPAN